MSYTPPAYAHLPNVNWAVTNAVSKPAERPTSGPAARSDINAVAKPTSETQATIVAENAAIREVYGSARIGAQIAVLTYQGKLVILAIWAGGEIEAIDSLEINDAAPAAGVTATHYTGTDGQAADATLIAAYASHGVTYADALPGIAYSVVVIPAADSAGFPSLTANIKGRKVYDPRSDTTGWSDNPPLCLADFIGSTVYGLARTVDMASVAAAADACDELVGGQKRRRIGLVLDAPGESRQWVEALRTYAGVWLAEGPDGLRLIPDRPASPVGTVTPTDRLAGSFKLKRLARRKAPNVVTVKWTDTTTTPWAEGTATAYAAGVETGALPRRESVVSLPGIQSHAQAMREAIERLNHFQLEDLEAKWTQFNQAVAWDVGDVVAVSHPIGLVDKWMRITNLSSPSPGRWDVDAREYDPAVHSDHVVEEPTYQDTPFPSPASPPAVTGLTLTEEVYQVETGTYSSRFRATWDAATYPYLANYRAELWAGATLIHTTTTREAEWATPTVQEGLSYTVKVVAVSTIGTVGTWATENASAAGKYLIPGDVPAVEVFEAGGRVYGSCSPAVDIDIWRYEWRYGTTGGTWETAKLIDRVDALRITSDQIPVGTWKVYCKAIDSVGQYSVNAASAPVTVTSDANAFLVDSYDSDSPTLTGMESYTLARTDQAVYYVTEDSVPFGTKFSSPLGSYTDALATYHASQTSTWLGEAEDFGQALGGQWTGRADVSALSGSLSSYLGLSDDGSGWTYHAGLSVKENGRFARLKHETLTTGTLHAVVPEQNIRLDAIPRGENGAGTSSAAGPVTITLENDYIAIKRLTITPEGTTARSATYDNIDMGNPTTFDVYVFNDAGVKIASAFRYDFQGV